jgi:esterase/lipase superfamily enzyme
VKAPFSFLLVFVFLIGCTDPNALSFTNEAEVGTVTPIYVATTRTPSSGGDFSSTRADQTHFSRYDVSVPKAHIAGQIEWSKTTKPDPAVEFALTQMQPYADKASFQSAIRNTLAAKPANKRQVFVYVHGFYNNFSDSLYRSAQISHDFSLDAVMTHFAWPSAASPFGYAHDRDAVLVARDDFEAFLRTLKASGASEVVIIAHSLGAALTMETLRSIAIEDKNAVRELVSGVILISPDLAVDLFVSQVNRIGNLSDFFVIVTSTHDRALELSARISGETSRLGNMDDLTPVSDLNALVVDVSALGKVRENNHLTAFENPEALNVLHSLSLSEGLFDNIGDAQAGLLPAAVISIRRMTRVVLTPADTEE